MSPNEIRQAVTEKLRASLTGKTLDLFTENGAVTVPIVEVIPNLVNVLMAFYDANKRFPKVVLNDGVPPSLADALKAKPNFQSIVEYRQVWYSTSYSDGAASSFSYPVLSVKVQVPAGMTVEASREGESGSSSYQVDVSGVHNTRGATAFEPEIPITYVTAGAFQDWGVLLVIYSRPDFVFATDDGIILTRDGVAMLERSLPYWLNRYVPFFPANTDIFSYDPGPVTIGMPTALLEKLRVVMEESHRRNGANAFFTEVLGMALSFVGFYFGANALNGLMSGAINSVNLSGTLNLASKFGVNTGNLSTLTKLADLTTGNVTTDTLAKGGPAMDDFWSDIGIDPGSIDYSSVSGMDTASFNDFFSSLGIDEFLSAVEGFGAAPVFDPIQIGIENDAAMTEALAREIGPMSATQMAQAASTPAPVAAAASAAMKAAGGNPSSVSTTPQQAAQAQQVAAQKMQAAAAAGNSSDVSLWSAASQLLKTYADYTLAEKKITASSNLTTIPRTTTYPTTAGQMVRQPDGSISVRNADGSITTIQPNGKTIHTGAGSSLPAFMQSKPLMYGLGAFALLAAYFIAKDKK